MVVTTSESKQQCGCLNCLTEASMKKNDEPSMINNPMTVRTLDLIPRAVALKWSTEAGIKENIEPLTGNYTRMARGPKCYNEAGTKKNAELSTYNYSVDFHGRKHIVPPSARVPTFANKAGMQRNAELSTYNNSIPFQGQNYMAQLPPKYNSMALHGRKYIIPQNHNIGRYIPSSNTLMHLLPAPRVNAGADFPESCTSFLRSDNSFFCPWSWDGTSAKTTLKGAYFEPGSFFEFQWDYKLACEDHDSLATNL